MKFKPMIIVQTVLVVLVAGAGSALAPTRRTSPQGSRAIISLRKRPDKSLDPNVRNPVPDSPFVDPAPATPHSK